MKKLLLLTLSFLLWTFGIAVGQEFVVGDLKYTVTSEENHEVSVAAAHQDISGDITIPATVELDGVEYSVTSIGTLAFFECGISMINIPGSVTSIEMGALLSCWALKEIVVDSSNTEFVSYDKSLYNKDMSILIDVPAGYESTTFTIPEGVSSIGSYAFAECSSLTSITIPESVTSIGEGAFAECSSLKSISIPESVTYIGDMAFAYCSSLSSITIPESVTSIGDFAFTGCSSLTSITIPESVTSIGNSAFSDCSSLGSITIPESVTSIGDLAFAYCHNLTTITIPKSVTSIGEGAFRQCFRLTTINIPESVTSIGKEVFKGSGLTTINIPESVTSIGDMAFADCSSLSSITIPASVTSIGSGAFSGCSSLTLITLPESVTSIGNSAFNSCSSLNSITIPESVISIGSSAFSSCSSLCSITIPESVTSIRDSLFKGCSSLTSIILPDSLTSIGNYGFYECSKVTSLIIPNSVTSIGDCAFGKCSSLTSVNLPNGIQSAGEGIFTECTSLTSISIPDGMTSISSCAFLGCIGLTTVSISESVTAIADMAFGDCSSLTSITIPESVTSIGVLAFAECSSLTSITIPESVTSIGDAAFGGCSSLTSITIPKGVTSIGEMAFSNCSSLTSITIPESVTSIGEMAFSNCSSLTSITIPESVTSIGEWTFNWCSKLSEVYSLNPEAPEANSTSFTGLPSDAILYVPKGSVEAYASAEGWSVFSDIREIKDQTYTVAFSVVYGENPIEGATVTFLDQEYTTDEYGRVVIADVDVEEGSAAKYTVYKYGYQIAEDEVEFGEETEMTVDVKLVAAEASLTVKIFAGYSPVEGAYMEFEGKEYFSDEAGSIAVTGLNALDYMGKTVKFTVYKDGYQFYEGEADFTEGLDAFVIVDLVAAEATLTVKVMDGDDPVAGARVTVLDSEYTTDENGEVKITGIDGPAVIGKTFAVTVEKEGYEIFEGEADFTETLDAYVVAELVGIQTAIADIIADIDRGDVKAYDLKGRRVMHPESGQIYIINGQKMLIKR